MSAPVNLQMSPMPTVWRKVTSITPAGSAPVRCLTLEDPRGLYITTDGIVTHNSPAKPSLTGGENAAPLKYHDTPDAFADSQAGRDLLARLREGIGDRQSKNPRDTSQIRAVSLQHNSTAAGIVAAFERAFSKRVVFVRGIKSDGLILDEVPSVIFANVEGENPIGFVMGAELRQRLEGSPAEIPTAEELGELFTSREEWNGISQDNADGVPSLYHTAARAANQMLEAMGMDQGLISSVLADYLKSGTVEQRVEKMIDNAQLSIMLGDTPPRANLLDSKINLSFEGPDVIMNDQANAELTYHIRERLNSVRQMGERLGGGYIEGADAASGAFSIGRNGDNFTIRVSPRSLSIAVRTAGQGVLTDAKAAVDALVEEELLHLAGLSFMREQWRADPRGLTFDEYFTDEMDSIWRQIHRESFENPDVKAAAVASWNTYADGVKIPKVENFRELAAHMQSNSTLRERMLFEMSRQMAQLWRSGRISESLTEPTGWWNKLKAWLSGALRTLHRAATSLKEGRWGSLLAQHAQNSLDMLAEAESGRTVGTQGNRNGAQNTFEMRLNPWHSKGKAYQVENQTLRAVLTGSLLPANLREVLEEGGRTELAVKNGVKAYTDDIRAQLKVDAKLNGTDVDTEMAKILPALHAPDQATREEALAGLSDNMQFVVSRLRNMLDQMSIATAQIANAAGNVTLANTIMLNLGQYLRTAYACHNKDSGYTYDRLVKLARAGKKTPNGDDAATVLRDMQQWYRNNYPTATAGEIEARIRNLMDPVSFAQSMTTASSSQQPGIQSDVSSFIARKEIPAELRRGMGEETNPLIRAEGSASFMAQFISRHETQQRMVALGLTTGLITPTMQGEYRVELPVDSMAWSGFIQPLQPDGSRQTLYTTKQLSDVLHHTYVTADMELKGDGISKSIRFLARLFRPWQNEAKVNKVVMNVINWPVNFIGGLVGVTQTGAIMNPIALKRAIALAKAGKPITAAETLISEKAKANAQALGEKLTPAQLARIAGSAEEHVELRMHRSKLTQAGVTTKEYQLAAIADIEASRLFQAFAVFDADNAIRGAVRGFITAYSLTLAFDRVHATVAGALGGAAGAFIGGDKLLEIRSKIGDIFIQGPDTFFKLFDFSDNYHAHLMSGEDEAVAFRNAAEKTLNTMPNYAKMWAWLKALSQAGPMGSFVAFKFETFRNTPYNVYYAAKEIASGKPWLIQRGIRRLAGTAAVNAGGAAYANAIGMMLMAAAGLGDGEDDEEKKRAAPLFLPDWDRYGNIAYAKITPDEMTYMNTSYLIPQAMLSDMVRAFNASKAPGDGIANVAQSLLDQFASGNVGTDPVIEAITNERRSTGAPITRNKGAEGKLDRIEHLIMSIYAPGTASTVNNITMALQGVERDDKRFSVEQEVSRVFGVRSQTRPMPYLADQAWKAIARESRSAKEAAKYSGNSMDPEAVLEKSRRDLEALEDRAAELEYAMSVIGFPDSAIKAMRKDHIFESSFELPEETQLRTKRKPKEPAWKKFRDGNQ